MERIISKTAHLAARAAAEEGARLIRRAIAENGEAVIILATGASQIGMLDGLTRSEVDWKRVTAFHLDEYIGLPETHPASFRRYLKERFVKKAGPKQFHFIDGEADPWPECERLGGLIREQPVDVAFIGIGENAHLAFNDPPANFDTRKPYIVVELDAACRNQQVAEKWFPSFEAVPERAISMSVRQILESRAIICTVPGPRKADAVKNALEGPVTPDVPASILTTHERCRVYLDRESSALLSPRL